MVQDIKPVTTLTKSFELRLRVPMSERFTEFDIRNVHLGSTGLLPKAITIEDTESFFYTYVFVAEFQGLYGSVKKIAEGLKRLGIPYYTDMETDSDVFLKQTSVSNTELSDADAEFDLTPNFAYSFHCKDTIKMAVNPKLWQYKETDDE
jgi:hypothetical protein